jgi:hypothetical protein
MANESLITFEGSQFDELMRTQGLENTVRGVLAVANDEIETDGVPLTLESLKGGTHPILDKLNKYKNLAPADRRVQEEEILSIFTNVEDFGKYDPEGGSFTGLKSFASGAGRMVPETVGAGVGFKTGLAAATAAQNFIPPLPMLLPVKGAIIAVGGVTGAILGAVAAGEAEDALIGEKAPVVPSLKKSEAAGETLMFAASMVATPYKLTSLPKAKTGALEFLENFKNVANKTIDKDTFLTYAKNAKFKPKTAEKIYNQAMSARKARAEGGQMFGGEYGLNLGFTRFNPAGRMLDPLKGPTSARVVGGIERGVGASLEAARQSPGVAIGLEAASGMGAATGAFLSDPYNPTERAAMEFVGSLFPPLIVSTAAQAAPSVFNTLKSWYGNRNDAGGLFEGKMKEEAANKIMLAIRRSEEYADTVEDGQLVETAEEKFGRFINELNNASMDDTGKILPLTKDLTTADLARANNLDFSATLSTIQNELSKTNADLATATGRGREQMQTGAVNLIRTLSATGDPDALTMAARVTQTLMEQNIIDNIDQGVTNLNNAAVKVLGREAEAGSDRVNLSEKLYEVLSKQVAMSKNRERKLWENVGSYPLKEFYSANGRALSQPNTLQILDRSSRQGGLNFAAKGTNTNLKSALGGFNQDIDDLRTYFQDGDGRNPASAQRFFEIRSGLLDKASQLKREGNLKTAESVNKLAGAVLQDLTGVKNNVNESYNVARAYTYARNNVFTRSFLKDIQEIDKDRALKLDAQQLLDEAFKGQYTAINLRLNEMREAGSFLIEKGQFSEAEILEMGTDDLIAAGMRDFMERVVDRKTVKDPLSGENISTFQVNSTKLNNEKRKPGFQRFLNAVPNLEKDLVDAETATISFNNMLGNVAERLTPKQAQAQFKFDDKQLNTLYGDKAFKTILENENPQVAVANALSSPHPVKALNALYNMVDRANMNQADNLEKGFTKTQALSGLKSAVYNFAEQQSTGKGPIDGDSLQKSLFGQIKGAPPNIKYSLMDFLESKKLVTEQEKLEVQQAIKTLKGVEEAFATGDYESVLFKKPSLAKLTYARIGGATAGSALQNKFKEVLGLPQMSGGLIAEQTGSEMVQKLFLQAPEAQFNKILIKLLQDPPALAAAMKTIKTDKDAKDAMSVLEKFVRPLVEQVGRRVPIGVRIQQEELRDPVEDPAPQPVVIPSAPPPSPAPQLQQPVPPPTQVQAPVAPPTASSSRPVDRSQYAALFPNDMASGIIRSQDQGIGSLMG